MNRKAYIIKREKKLVEKSSVTSLPEYRGLIAVSAKYTIVNTWGAIVRNAVGEWQFNKSREQSSKCMLDKVDIKTEYYITVPAGFAHI